MEERAPILLLETLPEDETIKRRNITALAHLSYSIRNHIYASPDRAIQSLSLQTMKTQIKELFMFICFTVMVQAPSSSPHGKVTPGSEIMDATDRRNIRLT